MGSESSAATPRCALVAGSIRQRHQCCLARGRARLPFVDRHSRHDKPSSSAAARRAPRGHPARSWHSRGFPPGRRSPSDLLAEPRVPRSSPVVVLVDGAAPLRRVPLAHRESNVFFIIDELLTSCPDSVAGAASRFSGANVVRRLSKNGGGTPAAV